MNYLENFFKRHNPQQQHHQGHGGRGGGVKLPDIKEHNVPKSVHKRATMDFTVGDYHTQALGQSQRRTVARSLCLMHAVKLIDYYSALSAKSSQEMQAHYRDEPRPLQEQDPNAPVAAKKFTAKPRSEEYDDWEEYVRDAELYAKQEAGILKTNYYARMIIPPSSNPIVERAARAVETMGETNPKATQELNNVLLSVVKEMTVIRVTDNVSMATLVLDEGAGLIATGLARNHKEAKHRCAMHALEILRLVKLQRSGIEDSIAGRDAVAALDGKTGVAKVLKEDVATCNDTSVLVNCGLSPRQAKVLNMLVNVFKAKVSASFRKEGGRYFCDYRLDDFRCTGQGNSRADAERHATEVALTELEMCDDRVVEINRFFSMYPSIDPKNIPTAQLPRELESCIAETSQRCREILGLPPRSSRDDDAMITIQGGGRNVNPAQVSIGTATASIIKDEDGLVTVDRDTVLAMAKIQDVRQDRIYAMELKARLADLRRSPSYLSQFHKRRTSLAICTRYDDIMRAIEKSRVTIICGTTGCGKTTQVPQFIFDREIEAGRGDCCYVLVTQPRRLSAFSVAERIANERLGNLGDEVGYSIRLDSRPGRHINLCTSGVLLQMMTRMPNLEKVSHLIIDEVHERDINCDFLLALVKQTMQRNPNIRLILMSATLQSSMFAAYFQGAPVIEVDGATYPVEEYYLEDVDALFRNCEGSLGRVNSFMFSQAADKSAGIRGGRGMGMGPRPMSYMQKRMLLLNPIKTDYHLIRHLIDYSIAKMSDILSDKSVLVFLPGWKEIIACKQALDQAPQARRYHMILLHSSVDAAKQRECFRPAPAGLVKIILATNIAESGITIDDAAVVIDTALIKQTSWVSRGNRNDYGNPSMGGGDSIHSFSTQLTLDYASQANCIQRKGRAGRTQGGVCYRLLTREVWECLPAYQVAEVHRVPLTQVLLRLLALGHDKPKEMMRTFIEPPSARNIEASMKAVQSLGAVTSDEKLTPLGLYLSKLPCDPHIGKMMMIGALMNCLDAVLTLAATADVSPFVSSRDMVAEVRQSRYRFACGTQSDHLTALNAYNAFCAKAEDPAYAVQHHLHMGNMRIISRYKQQFYDILANSGLLFEHAPITTSFSPSSPIPRYPPRRFRNGSPTCSDRGEDATNCDFVFGPTDGKSDYGAGANDVLVSSLFVDRSPFSKDSTDVAVVKACVCSSLFPHVAVLDATPISAQSTAKLLKENTKQLVMRTKAFPRISPSKDSACRRMGEPNKSGVETKTEFFASLAAAPPVGGAEALARQRKEQTPAMFYVYGGVFSIPEARQEFLTQVTSVSLWALLLFGVADAHLRYDRMLSICIIDDWIAIHMPYSSLRQLKELRVLLHECVWRRYNRPEDAENNALLEDLRVLCKQVLQAPLTPTGPVGSSPVGPSSNHKLHRLEDCGRIVSPFYQQPPAPAATANAAQQCVAGVEVRVNALGFNTYGYEDEYDDDDDYDDEADQTGP